MKQATAEKIEPDHDVIIVGAGPAGATLAWRLMEMAASPSVLANRGSLRVLLVENHAGKDYDAYHVKCGEGVSAKALTLISKHAKIVFELETALEHWGSTPEHRFDARGFIIDRPITLRSMIEEFEVLGGNMVNDSFLSARLEPDGPVSVKFESGATRTCRLLVGADGPNSRVRRACGFGNAKLTTLVQHVVDDSNRESTFTEIWYDQKYKGGYKYKFPASNGTAKIGYIHGTDEYHGDVKATRSRQVAWGGLETYYKDGVVLIGDAAAQCNPITGGGMRGAFVAADRLASLLVVPAGKAGMTSSFRKSAGKFSRWWHGTPYESMKYVKAHEAFEHMTNAELESFSEPLRVNILLILKKARWWWLYRAFMRADKYSW